MLIYLWFYKIDGLNLVGSSAVSLGITGNTNSLLITSSSTTLNTSLITNNNIACGSLNVGQSQQINKLQFGVASSSSNSSVTVTFSTAFLSIPVVVLTVIYGGLGYATENAVLTSTTLTNFTYIFLFNPSSHSESYVNVNWMAIA